MNDAVQVNEDRRVITRTDNHGLGERLVPVHHLRRITGSLRPCQVRLSGPVESDLGRIVVDPVVGDVEEIVQILVLIVYQVDLSPLSRRVPIQLAQRQEREAE